MIRHFELFSSIVMVFSSFLLRHVLVFVSGEDQGVIMLANARNYYKPCWTNVMTCRTIPSEMTTDGFGQRRINVKHLMVLHVK